jgi:type I restriction enzyme S subunit
MSTVGTIGRLNIVPDFQIFAIAQNVLGIRFKKDLISQLFMFCLMRTKGFNDEINSRLIETVQSSIKRSDLEKIPVILPKRILVERFDDIVKDMFDRIKTSSSEIDELINLRDILLSKLISGELVIYELSN